MTSAHHWWCGCQPQPLDGIPQSLAQQRTNQDFTNLLADLFSWEKTKRGWSLNDSVQITHDRWGKWKVNPTVKEATGATWAEEVSVKEVFAYNFHVHDEGHGIWNDPQSHMCRVQVVCMCLWQCTLENWCRDKYLDCFKTNWHHSLHCPGTESIVLGGCSCSGSGGPGLCTRADSLTSSCVSIKFITVKNELYGGT